MTRIETRAAAPAPVATVTANARGAEYAQLSVGVERAVDWLLARQRPEGYWVGELEADTTLESDYILLQLWLYQPDAQGRWRPPSQSKIEKAARYILERQTASGGWSIYPGGPDNVSATVKAYLALKLVDPGGSASALERARPRILELGGLEASNSYTKIYLSYFGLFDRDKTPTIPPEVFLLGESSQINIYEISAWSRAILAPLAILGAKKAARPVPAGFCLDELRSGVDPQRPRLVSWKSFFLWADKSLKLWERLGVNPVRAKAVDAAANWMIERLEGSGGLAAIFPAMMNSIMALTELGYSSNDPLLRREIERFEALVIEDEHTLRVQPCHSPVWDTAISLYALGAVQAGGGPRTEQALERASGWLISKECRRRGDWAVQRPDVEASGWYFEHENEFYPDCDDTAKVLLALEQAQPSDATYARVRARGLRWLAAMQSQDGGWAAFDVDNQAEILTHVPFADHNAMLDPSCADITGRALEALAGADGDYRQAIHRGVSYLVQSQADDGSWYGRWGVNYIYGTCFALRGLHAAGEDPHEAHIIHGGEFLRSIQNADGGWGESCLSYDDSTAKTLGSSTPSQTAWALMGLFATGDYRTGSVNAGLRYLLETQDDDGTWQEQGWTGTGFPGVFYLRYHLYPHYFPLMALGEYMRGKYTG